MSDDHYFVCKSVCANIRLYYVLPKRRTNANANNKNRPIRLLWIYNMYVAFIEITIFVYL